MENTCCSCFQGSPRCPPDSEVLLLSPGPPAALSPVDPDLEESTTQPLTLASAPVASPSQKLLTPATFYKHQGYRWSSAFLPPQNGWGEWGIGNNLLPLLYFGISPVAYDTDSLISASKLKGLGPVHLLILLLLRSFPQCREDSLLPFVAWRDILSPVLLSRSPYIFLYACGWMFLIFLYMCKGIRFITPSWMFLHPTPHLPSSSISILPPCPECLWPCNLVPSV